MTTFHFNKFGENLGTRQLGAKAREELVTLMKSGQKVVLDFSGVNVVSNSFADECIGKLLLVMSLDELKNTTTFKGINDFARQNVAIALRRRINAINNRANSTSSTLNWSANT